MSPLPRPIDRLLAGYNLVLAAVWALGSASAEGAGIAAAHVAAVGVPALLDRAVARRGLAGPARCLREGYPLLLLLAFWTELGHLLPQLHATMNDGRIARLDLAVFGQHWNNSWRERMPDRWLAQLMHFSYFLYLPLIYVPVVAAGVRGRTEAMRDMVFRLLVTYLACYLAYLAFPVMGPRAAGTASGLAFDGIFAAMSETLRSRGDSLGTAFPSSHAAGAVTVAIIAARWLGPWLAGLLAGQAVAVVFATVYTGNHYAVDAVAGVLLAVAAQLVAVPALLRILAPRPVPAPVPLLPRWGSPLQPSTSTGGRP